MNKKLQVFISSTYTDLRDERQAAVEAVLLAKHMPAGMELFTAGDESQLQVIKRWIKESDIYLLILGGRYGSVEPISGLSYSEIEYDFAVESGLAHFAQRSLAKTQDSSGTIETLSSKSFSHCTLSRLGRIWLDGYEPMRQLPTR